MLQAPSQRLGRTPDPAWDLLRVTQQDCTHGLPMYHGVNVSDGIWTSGGLACLLDWDFAAATPWAVMIDQLTRELYLLDMGSLTWLPPPL